MFKQDDGGVCCDQVIHYAPTIDRFIWLMQYSRAKDKAGNPTGPNRLRIAVASPQGIINNVKTACGAPFDLTSATFGLGNNWMDYPDLAVGNNFLQVSFDVWRDDTTPGRIMAEIPPPPVERCRGRILNYNRVCSQLSDRLH
jgi:hypothetical protein